MIPIEENIKNWFALYIKPRQDFKAEEEMGEISVEYYLPTIIVQKQWSDRKKKIREPLFRGYIFIHCDEKERLKALTRSSIVRCLCDEGRPAVIPEWQIQSLKKILAESPEINSKESIEIGAKVTIINGPLKNAIGVVKEIQGEKWLAVSIDLLNRSVLVKLPQDCITDFIEEEK